MDKLRKPGNKYHAQKTERVLPGGKIHVFDSKKEAERYDELAALEQAGEIHQLRLQPQFTIMDAYLTERGEPVRAIRYVADFSYILRGKTVVEDVKGMKTPSYKIKRKLMQSQLGINIVEV